jgi:Glucose / Sorbosone dehydrogenase
VDADQSIEGLPLKVSSAIREALRSPVSSAAAPPPSRSRAGIHVTSRHLLRGVHAIRHSYRPIDSAGPPRSRRRAAHSRHHPPARFQRQPGHGRRRPHRTGLHARRAALDYDAGCPTSSQTSPVEGVSRFTLPDTNVIDPASELVLIDNALNFASNHNGGDVRFGTDGYLYASIGDGGCDYAGDSGCGGSNDASGDRNILNGKIVRIAKDGSLPPDNPFLGAGTARCNTGPVAAGTICQETYLWGLRNPFRFAFQPGTGRLHVNDVGQGAWEGIEVQRHAARARHDRFRPGVTRANNAILGLFGTPAGNVTVASGFAAGTADLVIDVTGWWR